MTRPQAAGAACGRVVVVSTGAHTGCSVRPTVWHAGWQAEDCQPAASVQAFPMNLPGQRLRRLFRATDPDRAHLVAGCSLAHGLLKCVKFRLCHCMPHRLAAPELTDD